MLCDEQKMRTLRILAIGDVYWYHEVQNRVIRLSSGQLEKKRGPNINVMHSQDSLKPVLDKRWGEMSHRQLSLLQTMTSKWCHQNVIFPWVQQGNEWVLFLYFLDGITHLESLVCQRWVFKPATPQKLFKIRRNIYLPCTKEDEMPNANVAKWDSQSFLLFFKVSQLDYFLNLHLLN